MNIRLGPIKVAGTSLLLCLVLLAALYGLSALFWTWILMLVLGAVHSGTPSVSAWGYWQTFAPWGLLCPLVLG